MWTARSSASANSATVPIPRSSSPWTCSRPAWTSRRWSSSCFCARSSRASCGSKCSDAARACAPTSTSPNSSCSTASTGLSSSISATSPASTSSRRARPRSRSRKSSRTSGRTWTAITTCASWPSASCGLTKDMNADARIQFAAWIPEGDMGRFAKELPQRLKQDFAGTMKLLRNPDFQKLLLEYPRAKRTFLTTIEDKDVVTSQKLERYGRFDNAEDYLDAFSEFVKANADKVAALSVLLQRPRDWRPAVMDELKRVLSQNGFEPEKLQRAHRAKGFKALADVISIVKHASAVQSPLLTAEERVNRAMEKFIAVRKLTPEQMQWLSLVREHLVKNLSMDEEDFDLTPLLNMRGGKARALRVFGNLEEVITS